MHNTKIHHVSLWSRSYTLRLTRLLFDMQEYNR